jgi:O-antigen ligase
LDYVFLVSAFLATFLITREMFYFFIFFLPFASTLDQSVFLPYISVFALGLIGDILKRNTKRFLILLRQNNYIILFLVFYVLIAIGNIRGEFYDILLFIDVLIISTYGYFSSTYFRRKKFITGSMLTLLAGWVVVLFIGYLDYFHLINIANIFYMENIQSSKFHSIFPRASDYALYSIMIIPLLPILFIFIKRLRVAIFIMFVFLVLGEISLILSMDSGAWIVYPQILLLIWISTYFIIAKVHNPQRTLAQFLKRQWLKVLITIPLTIMLSVIAVYEIKGYQKNNQFQSATEAVGTIAKKAGDVIYDEDHLKYWKPSIESFAENPLFGSGVGSFRISSQADTVKSSGNLYLDILVENGLIGLVFFLAYIEI